MENENIPSPEQKRAQFQGVFDLDNLNGAQVGALIAALGLLSESQPSAAQGGTDAPVEEVLYIVGHDMTAYAERAPDKAMELFQTLAASEENWTKRVALLQLAEPLLKQYANEPDKRQAVIDLWVKLLDDNDEEVAETAADTLSSAVYSSHIEGWLDDSVQQHLDDKLPVGWRRHDNV